MNIERIEQTAPASHEGLALIGRLIARKILSEQAKATATRNKQEPVETLSARGEKRHGGQHA